MAASGMEFFESEALSYTNRCCHQGSPLSPRQRYVRLQSDQKDKSGFSGGGILHITRRSRPISSLLMVFYRQKRKNALFPHPKNADLSVSSHIYRNNSEKLFAGGAGVAEKTSLEFPAVGDERIGTFLEVR